MIRGWSSGQEPLSRQLSRQELESSGKGRLPEVILNYGAGANNGNHLSLPIPSCLGLPVVGPMAAVRRPYLRATENLQVLPQLPSIMVNALPGTEEILAPPSDFRDNQLEVPFVPIGQPCRHAHVRGCGCDAIKW